MLSEPRDLPATSGSFHKAARRTHRLQRPGRTPRPAGKGPKAAAGKGRGKR
jgi:ribonuclease R